MVTTRAPTVIGARASTVLMAIAAPANPMAATMTTWMTMAMSSAPSHVVRRSGRDSINSATPVSTSRAAAAPPAMDVAARMARVMGWISVDPR
jgi:hypothetical protein